MTNLAQTLDKTAAGSVQAELEYLDRFDGERPVSYADDPTRSNFSLRVEQVAIANARDLPPPSLAREGYQLVSHRSLVSGLPSPEEIETLYLPEARRLLIDVLGASDVHVFASGLRFNERSEHTGSRLNSRPARRVHSDFSDNGARETAAEAFGHDGQPPREGYWQCVNLWRVLTPPPQDTPLAMCDMRSIDPRDRVATQGVVAPPGAPEMLYEFCLYRPNPNHHWAYFRDMTRDEAIVFLGYDSRNPALRVPHCAFDDPSCPPSAPPRISIEVRACAYFAA